MGDIKSKASSLAWELLLMVVPSTLSQSFFFIYPHLLPFSLVIYNTYSASNMFLNVKGTWRDLETTQSLHPKSSLSSEAESVKNHNIRSEDL